MRQISAALVPLLTVLCGCGSRDKASDTAPLPTAGTATGCQPTLVASLKTLGAVSDVLVSGDYAYLASDGDALRIVDIRDPAAPTVVGFLPVVFRAVRMRLDGDLLYLSTVDRGFSIIDVSNPAHPYTVGSMDFAGQTFGLDVADGLAAIGNMNEGLRLVDVSDPTAPALLATVPTEGWVRDVAIAGDTLYAAVGDFGLLVVDIRNPASPVVVGGYERPGWPFAIAVDGGRAYLSDASLGLRIFDLASPHAPALITTWHSDDFAANALPVGDQLYVSTRWQGLQVLDLRDPAAPTRTAGFAHYDTWSVDVVGDTAYLAGGWEGLQIVSLCEDSGAAAGPTVGVQAPPVSACGDGALQSPETCDDADRTSGDGCSASCSLEPGWDCDTTGSPTICNDPADWTTELWTHPIGQIAVGNMADPIPGPAVDVRSVDTTVFLEQGLSASILASSSVVADGCGLVGNGCEVRLPMIGFATTTGPIGASVDGNPAVAPTVTTTVQLTDALGLDLSREYAGDAPATAFTLAGVRALSLLVGDAKGEVWGPDELLCRGFALLQVTESVSLLEGATLDLGPLGASALYLDMQAAEGPDGALGTGDDDLAAWLSGTRTDDSGMLLLIPDAACGTSQRTRALVTPVYDTGATAGWQFHTGWVPGVAFAQLVESWETP